MERKRDLANFILNDLPKDFEHGTSNWLTTQWIPVGGGLALATRADWPERR